MLNLRFYVDLLNYPFNEAIAVTLVTKMPVLTEGTVATILTVVKNSL